MEKVYSIREAAEYLGLTIWQVRHAYYAMGVLKRAGVCYQSTSPREKCVLFTRADLNGFKRIKIVAQGGYRRVLFTRADLNAYAAWLKDNPVRVGRPLDRTAPYHNWRELHRYSS